MTYNVKIVSLVLIAITWILDGSDQWFNNQVVLVQPPLESPPLFQKKKEVWGKVDSGSQDCLFSPLFHSP